jgi:hypothetical protein
MADWTANLLTTTKANLPDLLRDYSESAAKMDFSADTNIVEGSVRLSTAATYNYIEKYISGAWVPQFGTLLRDGAFAEDTNSAKFDYVSYSIPANALGTNKMLRATAFLRFKDNNTGAATLQLSAALGATTIFTGVAHDPTAGASANYNPYRVELCLFAQNSASAQTAEVSIQRYNVAIANNTLYSYDGGQSNYRNTGMAENLATAQTFFMSAQMSVSNVNVQLAIDQITLELI